MKKFKQLFIGIIVGLVLSVPVGAFANQLSLVGNKITGEYTVLVNGSELSDKAIVAGNKTFAPVRAFSEKMGGDISVDNNTKIVKITTTEEAIQDETDAEIVSSNPYDGLTEREISEKKSFMTKTLIPQTEAAINAYEEELQNPKSTTNVEKTKAALEKVKKRLEEYNEALKLMDEALSPAA
ncbi:stalk domain-containing protein [Paenibacillus senegalimassiliensis]|uniref:stalk domain-containing protein n=1 Tax=Paenibacillus senegalimassiliensis TaxID=1737426 RepID=UPI00073F5352|nr:stalk domain-containing protein [Paenibacillus senegalimassiliensis]